MKVETILGTGFRGKLGNLVFYVRNGKTCVRRLRAAGTKPKERTDRQKALSRRFLGVQMAYKYYREAISEEIWRVAGGWLLDYDGERRQEILRALTEGVRKLAREKGAIVVMISPNVEAQPRDAECQVVAGKDHLAVKGELERLGYKYLGEYEQAKWQYVLELKGQTAEGLFNEFRSGHRWQIRRAEKDGVRVRELGEGELKILKSIAKRMWI